jgi:hypothetical protein
MALNSFGGAGFNHHIFLKFMPEVVIAPEKVDSILRTLGEQYGRRMWKLRVSEVEVMALLKQPSGVVPVRFFASNPTGTFSFPSRGGREGMMPSEVNFLLICGRWARIADR